LLEGSSIQGADPRRGRFRSYLVGALKHFLANRKVHAAREKRGGAVWHEPMAEREESSEALSVPDPATTPTELLFDRAWALSVIERAFAAMLTEMTDPIDLREFEILKPWLTGESSEQTQAEAARQLGLSDGAMRVRIHRLRRRFRDLVKAEIAQTVQDPAEVPDELRHLIAVWGAARGA
jgi:DNA-directed RNA polymerase specialized sigma24 family protein